MAKKKVIPAKGSFTSHGAMGEVDETVSSPRLGQPTSVGIDVIAKRYDIWQEQTIQAGLERQHYSRIFRVIASLFIRPLFVSRISSPEALHFLGVIAIRIGKADFGCELISRAAKINPNLAADSEYGQFFLARSQFEIAESIYKKTVNITPKDADAWGGLGLAFYGQGKLHEAEKALRAALRISSNHISALANLSSVLLAFGRSHEALKVNNRLLRLTPESAEILSNRSNMLVAMGDSVEAEALLLRAIELSPDLAVAHSNLGNILLQRGDVRQAVASYEKAIGCSPDFAEAHSNLGNACMVLGELERAETCFRRALEINSELPEVFANLGSVLCQQERYSEAGACFTQAIELKPDYAKAHNNLGILFHLLNRFEEAKQSCLEAIRYDPKLSEAYENLGNTYIDIGLYHDAIDSFEKAIKINPQSRMRIRSGLLLAPIPESAKDIVSARSNLFNNIDKFEQAKLKIEDPLRFGPIPLFYLAYHGFNDRDMQKRVANFYLSFCSILNYTASHCLSPEAWDGKRKLRLGFVSAYLRKTHTIGKLFHGFVEHLPRNLFEIVLFRADKESPEEEKAINVTADKVIRITRDVGKSQVLIADEKLDILLYPDIGMNDLAGYLAYARLAPVQCVSWGHPETTGIPNIDYFISSELIELDGAEEHYSEKLIKLPRMPVYYHRPEIPINFKTRNELGLPANKNIYLCAQTLFKIHPDFDVALMEILEKDQNGLLIFLSPMHAKWPALLQERFKRTFPKGMIDRVLFMPPLAFEDFLSVNAAADVLLDTFHFSGGNTSLEAFALGKPVITLPGEFMRGRVTMGFYKQMGMDDLIARDPSHYVELAVRMATDTKWREEMSFKVKTRSNLLFEDRGAVDQLAAFLTEAVARV
jgi:protein O-GlcNAc transferase